MKKTRTYVRHSGIARIVCILLAFLYLAPNMPAIRSLALETSATTETADPTYGNERVLANDYENFPMTDGGIPPYVYGNDLIQNGDFDSAVGVVEAHYTDNLITGDGTYSASRNAIEAGESAESAVAGVWGNHGWADGYPQFAFDGDNTVVRITNRGPVWSHFLLNVEGQGKGYYTVSFDYSNVKPAFNVYCALGHLAPDTWTAIKAYGHTDANLVSAPGWQNLNVGTPIEGKENWFRYEHEYEVTFDGLNLFRVWAYVGADATGSFLADNISVTYRATQDDAKGTQNLVEGGGTFEGVIPTVGTAADQTVNGVWRTAGNAAVVLDGNNAVLELGYDGTSEGQAAHRFDGGNGKGKYRVEFDYTGDADGYVSLATADNLTTQTSQVYTQDSAENLFTTTGTDVDGRDGWKHFSAEIETADLAPDVVKLWCDTGADSSKHVKIDNLSVQYYVPEHKPESYTLQENDESGWTTTGTGVIRAEGQSYALTVTGDAAVTTKTFEDQVAGTYSVALKFKADAGAGASLVAKLGDAQSDNLALQSQQTDDYNVIECKLTSPTAFSGLTFETTGQVTLEDVTLRSAEINYGAASQVHEVAVYEGNNLVVDGGTLEGYLAEGTDSEPVARITHADVASQAKNGIWSNSAWGDYSAVIEKDGNNTVAKIGKSSVGAGPFAHAIWTFENQGAARYLVEFDYRMSGITDNCAVAVNGSDFNNANPSVSLLRYSGTQIADREGWYRFSEEFQVTANMQYVRLWYNTANNANNYVLMDNLSVKKQTGTRLQGEGSYVVPTEAPAVLSDVYSFATDAPAVIADEQGNAVVKMHGANYSSFFDCFKFEKAGVYAVSFDFRLEGETDNVGLRINPVEEQYTYDIPLLQYEAQWEESVLGEDWNHFVYYIKIDDEVAYKDASLQYWVHSANRATFSIDNLSVKRLVSADPTGNPVWGKELIADGGFETVLGNKLSLTVPNALNLAHIAVGSVRSLNAEAPAEITAYNGEYTAKLSGTSGTSSIANKAVLQNEGLYLVEIRYAVTDGYAEKNGASLTYALGSLAPQDILTATADGDTGFKVFRQYVRLTAEEAEAVDAVSVNFTCIEGDAAWIDSVSVKKEIGSDIPKEETPDDDTEGKTRYDLVSGGDFEGYDAGTSFGDSVTKDMFGTTSLDMPAQVVVNDKDAVNTSKVLLLQHQAGSQKDFSSAFNLYTSNAELEKGRTYYVTFDYKYQIAEPLDTSLVVSDGRRFTMDEGFTFCFVGGTNIGHHEIYLGSVEDGDQTAGANNQKCKISKTDLGEGWSRITFAFTANTGINVACNSFRFLLLTNKNTANYAMFDNVALYTYYDNGDVPPTPPDGGDEKPDPQPQPTPAPSDSGCGSAGCGSSLGSVAMSAVAICALLGAGTVLSRRPKKHHETEKEERE